MKVLKYSTERISDEIQMLFIDVPKEETQAAVMFAVDWLKHTKKFEVREWPELSTHLTIVASPDIAHQLITALLKI